MHLNQCNYHMDICIHDKPHSYHNTYHCKMFNKCYQNL